MANNEPTTALETLGTYITGTEARDAIHLAVVPICATERVFPGQHVTASGKSAGTPVGIVDPFLPGPVQVGQWFWLTLYPRTITSLRHAWTHPAFPEAAPKAEAPKETTDKDASRIWLEDFASRLFSYYGNDGDDEYGSRLDMLIAGIEYGGGFGTDIEYGDDVQPSDELYHHYEVYTGKPAPPKPEYFRCAC